MFRKLSTNNVSHLFCFFIFLHSFTFKNVHIYIASFIYLFYFINLSLQVIGSLAAQLMDTEEVRLWHDQVTFVCYCLYLFLSSLYPCFFHCIMHISSLLLSYIVYFCRLFGSQQREKMQRERGTLDGIRTTASGRAATPVT